MTAHDRLQRQIVDTLKAHLATGARPVVPEAGRLIWSWFIEISATRTYNPAGPNPISYGEIEAWARLNRWPIEPCHVEAIVAMDRAYLDHAYSKAKAPDGTKILPRGSGQAVNPAAFDAVFG